MEQVTYTMESFDSTFLDHYLTTVKESLLTSSNVKWQEKVALLLCGWTAGTDQVQSQDRANRCYQRG